MALTVSTLSHECTGTSSGGSKSTNIVHCIPNDVSQQRLSLNDNDLPPLLARQHDDDDGVVVYWTNNGPIETTLSCDTEKFVDRVTNKDKRKDQVADGILGNCSSATSISSSRECTDSIEKSKSGKS